MIPFLKEENPNAGSHFQKSAQMIADAVACLMPILEENKNSSSKKERKSHIPSRSLSERTDRNATTALATSTDANGHNDFCGADGANLRKG